MKKFLVASFIPALLFTACQPASQPAPVSQNILNDCLAVPELDESNKCLMKVATDMVYYEIYEKDIQVCKKMSKDLPYYQECYWLFAMIQKDPKICELLPEKSGNVKLQEGWFADSIDYLTKGNCKNEFHFESENAEWNLVSGIPPMADPQRLYYKGNAEIQGWLVKEPGYTDELVTYFHISEDSKKKLPPGITYSELVQYDRMNFALKYNDKKNPTDQTIPQAVISKLEKYNEKNPATIKVDGISIQMEGAPVLHLAEIETQTPKSNPYPETDYEKISQVLEKSTYLRGQVESFRNSAKEICQNINPNKELAKQIKDFVSQSQNSESSEVGGFDKICQKGENIYVVFGAKGPATLVSLWKDKKTFEFFKDEKNKPAVFGSDNFMELFPESLNGKSMVYTSGKDEPAYFWAFYLLDQNTMKSTLIESCSLEFEYDSEKSLMNADKSKLDCSKTYKLVN